MMTDKEFFDFIRKNGMTNEKILDFVKEGGQCYLINTRQILEKFKKDGFFSEEITYRLNNIFDDLNITLGQLDLFFHNYENDLKNYLLTGKMNQDTLMLLKNNFYSSNQIARQFVKWINEWANNNQSGIYHLKKENFMKWITCVDEIEFFRCLHCDNYKKKIESTLTDDEDFEFFAENKDIFKKQLYCVLNFDIEKSLEITEEIAKRRTEFNERNSNSYEEEHDFTSLEEIILSRIKEMKKTRTNQLIQLPSDRHAFYMILDYPFSIMLLLLYHGKESKSIDLSSDNIIERTCIGYNATVKENRGCIKEMIDIYEDVVDFEEAWISSLKDKTQ